MRKMYSTRFFSGVGMEAWSFLFLVMMGFGLFTCLSAVDWYVVWFGVELNSLGFLGFLASGNRYTSGEAVAKYIMVQSLGGIVFLLGGVVLSHLISEMSFYQYVLAMAMFIKAGFPPFHFWYPSVVSDMDWGSFFLLSTFNKLVPLTMVVLLHSILMVVVWVCGVSMIWSGIGGLSQSSVRGILAYSSMGHMSWMFASGCFSMFLMIFYFLFYFISMGALTFVFFKRGVSYVSEVGSGATFSLFDWFVVFITISSLAGIPPFVGFVPKLMVVVSLSTFFPYQIFLMLLGSVIHLFYYSRLIMVWFLGGQLVIFNKKTSCIGSVLGGLIVLFHLLGLPWMVILGVMG